jgi:hypothetical protein
LTKVVLEIKKSEKSQDFFFCSSVEDRFGVATGRDIEEAKLAGELMLYKIKAAQDMMADEGRKLSETQTRLAHPIEIQWVIC